MGTKIDRSSGIAFACIVGAVYAAFYGTQIGYAKQWKDIGEGFSVNGAGGQRLFYMGDNSGGAARCCLDKDDDGVLDGVFVNAPISPYMGGPGYRLIRVETTEEDREKFERANYLFGLENRSEAN
ncbi:MAG: hypothetical protein ABH864_00890 [archaeon]